MEYFQNLVTHDITMNLVDAAAMVMDHTFSIAEIVKLYIIDIVIVTLIITTMNGHLKPM